MGSTAFQLGVDFETVTCAECGIVFALPVQVQQNFLNNHDSFYCPYGHSSYYPGESDKEKLQKKLEREQAQLARAQKSLEWANTENAHLKNTVRAHKGAKTRLKKRLAAGVCPCCNRSFSNLRRHMDTQHKEYAGASCK